MYTLFFSSERNDRVQIEDHNLSFTEAWSVSIELMKSKRMLTLLAFFFTIYMFSCVNEYAGKIYLLHDMQYSQTKYSLISLLYLPVTFLTSYILANIPRNRYLNWIVLMLVIRAVNDILIVNVLYYFTLNEFIKDILLLVTMTVGSTNLLLFFSTWMAY
mmetsp:Transcript_24170/g.27880  ORF Transcript_24170/g.27880 Transcript_24170/m.27880 type:complete len:159 (-) Transcript_24170:192-668(-)